MNSSGDTSGNNRLPSNLSDWQKQVEHHRTYVTNSPLAIMVVDASGRYVEVNPAACRISGYDEAELLAMSLGDLLAAESLEAGRKHFALVKEVGRASGELCWVRKDGSTRWSTCDAIKLSEDRFLGYCLDITDRKMMEESLRQSERKYRCLFENSLDAIFLATPEGGIKEANPAACAMLGMSKDEILRAGRSGVVDTADPRFPAYVEGREQRGRIDCELTLVRKDGSKFPVDVSSVIVEREEESSLAFVIARDITARKRAEESLRHSQAELRAIYEHTPVIMCVLDADRRVVYSNRALSDFVGKSSTALKGERACGILGCLNALDDPRGCGYGRQCESCSLRLAMLDTFQTGLSHLGIDYRPTLERKGNRQEMAFLGSTALLQTDAQSLVLLCLSDFTDRVRAENAVKQSAHTKQVILDSLPAHIAVLDKSGRITSINSPWVDFAKHNGQDDLSVICVGADYLKVCRESAVAGDTLASEALAGVQMVLDGKRERFTLEYPCHAPWQQRWFFMDVLPLGQGTGGAVVAHLDITGRKEAEESLRVSEERYRSLFTEMTEGFALHEILCDEQGEPCDYRFLDVNPAFEQLTGLKHSEVIGKTMREVLPGEHLQWIKIYGAVALTGQSARFERYSAAIDRYYDVYAYRPAPGQFAVIFTDITNRKRNEEMLREAQERLELAKAAAREGIWDWDIITSHCEWSPEMFALFGLNPDTTQASLDTWKTVLHPDDRSAASQRIEQAIQEHTPLVSEYRIVRPDGHIRWISAIGKTTYSNTGRALRMIGVCMDISDRKQAEHEKLEMERRLLHAQKLESLGILAGGIAHDFNNILAGIMGYADLAKLHLPAADLVRADVDVIKTAAQRAADLTRQMLAYSGKGKFIVEAMSLSQVVEDSKKILAMSVSKKATVTYDLAANLPVVEADAAQMCQVVMNLIINASEALGEQEGVIAVSTNTRQCEAQELPGLGLGQDLPKGLYICLEVADTGCGMDEQTVAKIFDPFFTTKLTGRGLGLAAVHGIVRGHKGTIQVLSELGKGTTFRVFFPASASVVPAVRSKPAATAGHGNGTVLIVDDEAIIRRLAQQMLEHAGFSTLTASGGRDAIRLFGEHRHEVNCVLLDLTMPDLDGAETFHELRLVAPDVPVILSSGYNEETATARFTGEGLAGFIQKPYQLDTLIAKLRGVVADSDARRKPSTRLL